MAYEVTRDAYHLRLRKVTPYLPAVLQLIGKGKILTLKMKLCYMSPSRSSQFY